MVPSVLVVVLSLALLVPSCLGGTYKWTVCTPAYATVLSSSMSPDPARDGQNATFTSVGFLPSGKSVTGGTWTATAYLGHIKVETFSGEVCSVIVAGCTSNRCPCVGPVNATAVLSLPIPDAAPHGSTITAEMRASDQDGVQFLCINASFQIQKS